VRRQTVFLIAAVAGSLLGCSNDDIALFGAPEAGSLVLEVVPPEGQDAGMWLAISAFSVDSITPIQDVFLFDRDNGRRHDVVVLGSVREGPLLRVYLHNKSQAASVEADLLGAVEPVSYRLREPVGYELRFTQE